MSRSFWRFILNKIYIRRTTQAHFFGKFWTSYCVFQCLLPLQKTVHTFLKKWLKSTKMRNPSESFGSQPEMREGGIVASVPSAISNQQRIWGGGGGCLPLLQGFDPCRPKGSPLCTILRYPFLADGPKFFSKGAFDAKSYYIWGGARAKKRNFLVKIFQKVPKNAFFGLFFQKFACGTKNLVEIGSL